MIISLLNFSKLTKKEKKKRINGKSLVGNFGLMDMILNGHQHRRIISENARKGVFVLVNMHLPGTSKSSIHSNRNHEKS